MTTTEALDKISRGELSPAEQQEAFKAFQSLQARARQSKLEDLLKEERKRAKKLESDLETAQKTIDALGDDIVALKDQYDGTGDPGEVLRLAEQWLKDNG